MIMTVDHDAGRTLAALAGEPIEVDGYVYLPPGFDEYATLALPEELGGVIVDGSGREIGRTVKGSATVLVRSRFGWLQEWAE